MDAREAKKQRAAARHAKLSKKRLLTEDVIKRATTLRQRGDESKEHFYERVTSLSLQGKRLYRVENLQVCPNLRVLFMYNNSISKMENLSFARNLTHLSLENNNITHIEDIKDMRRLVKLRLDGNHIARLEGLGGCVDLQEVHLNDQTLEDGERLEFELESLQGVADSLCILGISGTRCDDILPLVCLMNLRTFRADKNDVAHMAHVQTLLESCTLLEHIALDGNPVAGHPDYRDIIVANSELLQSIDDKPIKPNQRAFLQARNHRRELEGRALPCESDAADAAHASKSLAATAGAADVLEALRISACLASGDASVANLDEAAQPRAGKPQDRASSRSSSPAKAAPSRQLAEPSFAGLLNVGAVRMG